jgi:2-polyprenyl-3-methyl-5-hydroxy-6-metoxy-1,4-benzoquinol methylase
MSTNEDAVTARDNRTQSEEGKDEDKLVTFHTQTGLSIDDIMRRVRAEVARRRIRRVGTGESPKVRPFVLSMPDWAPAVPRLQRKDRYHLSELLAYSDADFIDAASLAILRRSADEPAFNRFLAPLRNGALTKISILQTLMASPEGQAGGVQIDGMFLPSLLERLRRKKFLGPVFGWAHALLRLEKSAIRQAQLDAYQAQEIQELGRIINEGMVQLAQSIDALTVESAGQVKAAEFETLKNEVEKMKLYAGGPETVRVKELTDSPASQLTDLEAEVRTKFRTVEEHLNRLSGSQESMAGSIQQMLSRDEEAATALRALDPFYAAFEDHFRGDRAVIRTRVQPYLALVREVGAGTPEAPVVDIGCGRGELLEVIRDYGMIGKGIEINRVFIDTCRGLGLDILEGEAVQSLRAMPEGSVGAITAMHVIEHLPFEHAIALLDEMRRVLRPGGLIIVETPNPENLSVGHLWFYMDPTHRNPLPPTALRWIVEARGFDEVRIERLVLAREINVPPPLAEDVPGAAAINTLLASMRVASDYAIVGKRP